MLDGDMIEGTVMRLGGARLDSARPVDGQQYQQSSNDDNDDDKEDDKAESIDDSRCFNPLVMAVAATLLAVRDRPTVTGCRHHHRRVDSTPRRRRLSVSDSRVRLCHQVAAPCLHS